MDLLDVNTDLNVSNKKMIMFLAWKNVAINFAYLLGMNQIWLVFTTKYK